VACVNNVAKLSNRSSRNLRALDGVRSSNTSSDEEGIFHNSSQKGASSGETSRVVREVSDSRNLILEAEAPIVFVAYVYVVGLWCVFLLFVLVNTSAVCCEFLLLKQCNG